MKHKYKALVWMPDENTAVDVICLSWVERDWEEEQHRFENAIKERLNCGEEFKGWMPVEIEVEDGD